MYFHSDARAWKKFAYPEETRAKRLQKVTPSIPLPLEIRLSDFASLSYARKRLISLVIIVEVQDTRQFSFRGILSRVSIQAASHPKFS